MTTTRQDLIDAVIESLKTGFQYEDFTVLDELLSKLGTDDLLAALPDNHELSNTATKHTPGPWETPSLEDSRSIRSTDTGEYVATAHSKHDFSGLSGTYPDADAAEANGRLIAAAPELLDAAQSCLTSLNDMVRDQTMEGMKMVLEQAIAKATG